jgi:NADH:ubiquinone oxidoreductase subunit 5 (subunit L)/multisubunit Na+/H+ antiporter MnhA subunit
MTGATFGGAIAGLALGGGLAAACFVKAAGVAFLGEPRSEASARAREVEPPMRWTMLGLAAGCLLLGVGGPIGLAALEGPARQLLPEDPTAALLAIRASLWAVGGCGLAFASAALGLCALRRRAWRASGSTVETWGCGYAAPTPRMQYTASSFAQPLTSLFAPVLRTRARSTSPQGAFPGPASFSSHAEDVAELGFERAFRAVAWLARHLRPIQAGSTQLYVLYAVLAALALVVWRVL